MNNIQYVSTVTTDKATSLKLKCTVSKNKTLFLKNDCSWSELKELIYHGCTIARTGTTSTYIALDIDDSEITHVEMLNWWSNYTDKDNVVVTASASGKEYKHHVYFNVPEFGINDTRAVTLKCFSILSNYFAGKKINLDKNAWSFWQCMFNTGKTVHTFVLDGSIQLNDWVKKFEEPVPYVEAATEEEYKEESEYYDKEYEEYLKSVENHCIIPNNVEWYMSHLLEYGYGTEHYAILPFELLSRCYVKKGYRHTAMLKVVDCVVKNYLVNAFFGIIYDEDDIFYTIKSHFNTYFEDGTTYYSEDIVSIQNAVKDIFHKYSNFKVRMTLQELIAVLGKGHHRLGIKSFAKRYIKSHNNLNNIDDTCYAIVALWFGPNKMYEKCGEIDEEFINTMIIVRHEIKSFFENKKVLTITNDVNESKMVYGLTKDVQLFDDTPTEQLSFEEFSKKSTAGAKISFVNTIVNFVKKHIKEHTNKGKCLANYEINDSIVTIPRDKVTNAIRKYCSKNHIKINRI